MTPDEAVRGVAGPVGVLGGAWMQDPVVLDRGRELGLSGWSWYHCGRGGVLGDVHPDVVAAAFAFFPPHLVRKAWDRGRAVLPPVETAGHYARACAEWGRRTFDGLDRAWRLAWLLERAVGAVDPAGLPLFAAWRLHLDPALDGPARLALALQVAREHRGGAHALAVVHAGIAPLQAVVSGRHGPANAAFFGWPEPWPDPAAAAAAMAKVESATDRLVRPAYDALGDAEREELVTGLRAVREQAMRLPLGTGGSA